MGGTLIMSLYLIIFMEVFIFPLIPTFLIVWYFKLRKNHCMPKEFRLLFYASLIPVGCVIAEWTVKLALANSL